MGKGFDNVDRELAQLHVKLMTCVKDGANSACGAPAEQQAVFFHLNESLFGKPDGVRHLLLGIAVLRPQHFDYFRDFLPQLQFRDDNRLQCKIV